MQSLPMWTSRFEGVEVLDKVLAWIMEWLTWRRQKVVLNGEKSEWGVGGNDLVVAAVGRKGHMRTWWPASRFEVIKAAFSLMLTVQFHPFFNIIHLVANQIRHRFIEDISNTFFSDSVCSTWSGAVWWLESRGFAKIVFEELWGSSMRPLSKSTKRSVRGDLDENGRKS